MSEHEFESQPPVTSPVIDPTKNTSSVLEALAQKREEQLQESEALIPVPGYDDPKLLIKYKLLAGQELTAIGRKVQKQTKDEWYRQLWSALDVMIAACTGIYVQLSETEEPTQLTIGGQPVEGFTVELAESLRIEKHETVREIVKGIFNNNDVAIGTHSFRLQRWMSDTSSDVDADLFGPGA